MKSDGDPNFVIILLLLRVRFYKFLHYSYNGTVQYSLKKELCLTLSDLFPRARAKRNQIRSTAQKLFLQNGFSATSMDAITAEAGVSKQTLYAYYSSKEDLLIDVLQQLIQNFFQDQLLVAENLSVSNRDELEQILYSLAQKLISNLMQPEYLALIRITISEATRFPQLGMLFRSKVPERGLQSITALLEQARAQGVIKVADVETVPRMFIGPILTYVVLDGLFITDGPPRQPHHEQISKIVHLFMKTLD